MSGVLDLPAYLDRVGYQGGTEPTVATLHAVHRAHVAAIGFEGIDAAVGTGIDVELAAIQDKLVRRHRGGYCYEHNLLFAAVLERLGFPVTRLLARVRHGGERVLPKTHATNLVEADGRTWLADVGFGGAGLIEPIPLTEGAAVSVDGWEHRIGRDGLEWVLQAREAEGWSDLYGVIPVPIYPADFEMANYFTSTNAHSPFVNKVRAQHNIGGARHALNGRELTITRPDGTQEVRELEPAEARKVLREIFKIHLTDDEDRLLREHLSQ